MTYEDITIKIPVGSRDDIQSLVFTGVKRFLRKQIVEIPLQTKEQELEVEYINALDQNKKEEVDGFIKNKIINKNE